MKSNYKLMQGTTKKYFTRIEIKSTSVTKKPSFEGFLVTSDIGLLLFYLLE